MTTRPHEILELPATHFAGGANIDDSTNSPESPDLMEIVKGAVERPPILAVTADYTLTADDEGKVLEVDPDGGTVSISLPQGLPVGFFVSIRQVGTGTARIIAATPAPTINVVSSAADPISISGQWASAVAEVRATDTFIVFGQLTEA